MNLLGHPSWPKEASRRAHVHVRGQRPSFGGLRRVKKFIQDAKGMCKKRKSPVDHKTYLRDSARQVVRIVSAHEQPY